MICSITGNFFEVAMLAVLTSFVSPTQLKWARRTSNHVDKRSTFFTAHCPGMLPQSPSDYPQGIGMQPSSVVDGTVVAIQYYDRWNQREDIYDLEALCDRAGCYCNGPTVNCNNVEGLFYEPVIAAAYADICFHTCHCLALPETPELANSTNQVDLGGGNSVDLPQSLQNVRSRLNPDGSVLRHGACFAGEAAGWTFENLASKTCCTGYSFNALSAQEAYMIFGFPYVSDIVAGIVTIGVCLKTTSPGDN